MQRSADTGHAQALTFLHRVFADDDLRRTLGHCPTGLADLVELGRTMGLDFDPAELQEVYRQEFTLRWAVARMGKAPSAEAN